MIFKFRKQNNSKTIARPKLVCGFTLVELMMVVAIIGIFAAVTIPSYLSSKAKSRDSVRLGDLKSISLAIQNYWQDNNYKWPGYDKDGNVIPSYSLYNDPIFKAYFSGGVPKDPLGKSYVYTAFGQGNGIPPYPKGTDSNTHKKDFCISAMMETIPSSPSTLSPCDQTKGTVGTDYNYNVVGP